MCALLGQPVDLGAARLAVPKWAEVLWSASRCLRHRADAAECPRGVMREGFQCGAVSTDTLTRRRRPALAAISSLPISEPELVESDTTAPRNFEFRDVVVSDSTKPDENRARFAVLLVSTKRAQGAVYRHLSPLMEAGQTCSEPVKNEHLQAARHTWLHACVEQSQ